MSFEKDFEGIRKGIKDMDKHQQRIDEAKGKKTMPVKELLEKRGKVKEQKAVEPAKEK